MRKIESIAGLIVQLAASSLAFPPSGLAAVVPPWFDNDGSTPQLDVVVAGASTAIALSDAELVAAKRYTLVYADHTFTAANTDIVTITGHTLQTGDGPFALTTTGTLPAGLVVGTPVWWIRIDANTGKYAASLEDALKGIPIDITTTGTGTHTIADNASTKRITWLSCGEFPDSSLTATKGAMKRFDVPVGSVAYALVGTLDTGNVTVEVSPVIEVA